MQKRFPQFTKVFSVRILEDIQNQQSLLTYQLGFAKIIDMMKNY
jgi:hypothetical protein